MSGQTVVPYIAVRIALAMWMLAMPALSPAQDLQAQVNTFIGSKDEGNTFPGASAPFGLIQVSPVGEHYAGWRYDDTKIRGFGHSFLSGAGCWEQGGQVTVLPVTGRTVTNPPCSQHPAPERKECPKPRILSSS